MNELTSVSAAAELIRRGVPLSVAGPEDVLRQLPAGNWIGGTIPYFMAAGGGVVVTDERLFVTDLSKAGSVSLAYYPADQLQRITTEAPDNSFSLTIIPAGGEALSRFAREAATYEDAFVKPTVGWIAGVHLSELGSRKPLVFDGRTGQAHADGAVVAHIRLADDKLASVEIINIFEPDGGDVLRFDRVGFEIGECEVAGRKVNLAAYLKERGIADGRLPLVGDYAGAHINVSFQTVDVEQGKVVLYAPVFPGVDYRIARPVGDYAAEFRRRLAEYDATGAVFSCNCILNFLFGELEGKAIGGVEGPVTFGEIGYQLLNQTMVVVRLQ
ncbi:hypothetical protein C7444_10126 [Sphaerotilus hippei]|uniref:Uncharacterized protein n=1 Tax=Sphaerotilus hippei TaxID=744406 RepID=A0A318H5F8_9BURK|nr:hypothetical protein [Sphaerotilus hippei]PXW99197.1 hypothetical protein C7444_10126 [Sphaerotilus hippei]